MEFESINVISLKQVIDETVTIASEFIRTPKDAVDVINEVFDLKNRDVEYFGLIALNTKNQIAGMHIVTVGTINASLVHPREVYKRLLLNNAASYICFHNHPSGNPQPSSEDASVTKRLVEVGTLIGIELLDHVIVGNPGFSSLKELGMM